MYLGSERGPGNLEDACQISGNAYVIKWLPLYLTSSYNQMLFYRHNWSNWIQFQDKWKSQPKSTD